jgi:hypothetical protein
MIKMLGGAPEALAVPPAPVNPQSSGNYYPAYPNPAAPPQAGVYYPPLPSPGPWPEAPPQQAPYAAPPPPGFAPAAPPRAPEPARPTLDSGFYPTAEDDDGKTRFIGGVDIDKLKIPKYTYTLQILDTNGQWRDWGPIHANGLNVGRAKNSADFPGLSSMAVRHMKFSYDRTTLTVEDLGSLNGIYVRVLQPVELIDGMRFRIGGQTLEFHQADPFEALPPTVADDGEEYCSRDLEPLAYIDLIRPNGRPGLRFPITKLDATVLGREGPNAHIALTNDNSVSASHAQIRREDGKFYLEDLKSRNGTFVHVLGSSAVKSGDVILAGRVLFRVVEHGGG